MEKRNEIAILLIVLAVFCGFQLQAADFKALERDVVETEMELFAVQKEIELAALKLAKNSQFVKLITQQKKGKKAYLAQIVAELDAQGKNGKELIATRTKLKDGYKKATEKLFFARKDWVEVKALEKQIRAVTAELNKTRADIASFSKAPATDPELKKAKKDFEKAKSAYTKKANSAAVKALRKKIAAANVKLREKLANPALAKYRREVVSATETYQNALIKKMNSFAQSEKERIKQPKEIGKELAELRIKLNQAKKIAAKKRTTRVAIKDMKKLLDK